MLRRDARGDVALLTLAHGKASALDLELLVALDAALAEEQASGARALVLTGQGHIFSAGVDLFRVLDGGRAYLQEFLPALDRCLLRLFRFDKPVVCAVNGHAIAGGCIIACAADLRLFARGPATIGAPELLVGVPFPPTPLAIVRFAVPAGAFQRAVLSGRNYRADDALAAGLVDELVEPEELLPQAVAAAERMAAVPRRAFAHTKAQLRQPTLDHLERHADTANSEVLELWTSEPVRAAIRGYVERTLRR
jgi:enoyl-CoA hydratase